MKTEKKTVNKTVINWMAHNSPRTARWAFFTSCTTRVVSNLYQLRVKHNHGWLVPLIIAKEATFILLMFCDGQTMVLQNTSLGPELSSTVDLGGCYLNESSIQRVAWKLLSINVNHYHHKSYLTSDLSYRTRGSSSNLKSNLT